MTLYYDGSKQRIVCCWQEPTPYVMGKKPVLINRFRSITTRVTKRGRISKTDRDRYWNHPMFRSIQMFSHELQVQGFFSSAGPKAPCQVCGEVDGVAPHFDPASREVAWLCDEHGYAIA